mmetsp:Transcript_14428/g.23881  ORF Transcript_14428/g.23881 Transcript_14428/m.23881 type:complete len:115 (-) Transcript_14428:12-356(-)
MDQKNQSTDTTIKTLQSQVISLQKEVDYWKEEDQIKRSPVDTTIRTLQSRLSALQNEVEAWKAATRQFSHLQCQYKHCKPPQYFFGNISAMNRHIQVSHRGFRSIEEERGSVCV